MPMVSGTRSRSHLEAHAGGAGRLGMVASMTARQCRLYRSFAIALVAYFARSCARAHGANGQ